KDGFHVVRHLPQGEMPAVIFVTAHDHYAVKAFDVHATDYLLKPPDPHRLADALETARRRMQSNAFATEQMRLREIVKRLSTPGKGTSELIARDRGKVLKIAVTEIDWLQAEDNYVRIHANGSSHLIRRTIASLERDLDRDVFLRIHRSAIVNIQRARELRRSLRGGYTIVLTSGEKLRVSRAHRRRVADLFRTNTRGKVAGSEPHATS
ncbi:MAG TPA: LytTR family DNA-binding domain-containing protein, partial [Gemmatimonadaceae bacterium]|nr:LytTR family DNA-binding domain-containing protein [Gemmatimonadaceae bacterium]